MASIRLKGRPSERLADIYDALSEIIDRYRPEQIAVEELFWNTNVTTGIRVAEARGVILLCAQQKGLVMQEYTPMQVKQAVVGYGKAEKKQVITMVTMMLGLPKPPKPDDTADALAIAVCHAHSAGSALAQYYNKP
jgi:crossover junction endodeoxyribonuclease RuvC